MIDGSHLKWADGGTVAVRWCNDVDNDDDDINEQCEKSLNVETPESDESPLIDEIVSSDVICNERIKSFHTSSSLRSRLTWSNEASVSSAYFSISSLSIE